MKRIAFTIVLAAALLMPVASTASAAPVRAVGHVAGHVIVRPYPFYPAFGWGYDPFWYGWGPSAYPYAGPVTGGLRVEVTPKTAQVFVDGYFAGVVDDFNGHFHHLDLTPGGHTIEIHAPGFQPLKFSTYIQPDHTSHYKANMVPLNSQR
jgi:hypothetical protein